MIPSDSTILQTLQKLMFDLETEVRKTSEEYIYAKQNYLNASQRYQDIRSLYEEKYAILKDSDD